MFSGGCLSSLDVARAICAPAEDKATSNILKECNGTLNFFNDKFCNTYTILVR